MHVHVCLTVLLIVNWYTVIYLSFTWIYMYWMLKILNQADSWCTMVWNCLTMPNRLIDWGYLGMRLEKVLSKRILRNTQIYPLENIKMMLCGYKSFFYWQPLLNRWLTSLHQWYALSQHGWWLNEPGLSSMLPGIFLFLANISDAIIIIVSSCSVNLWLNICCTIFIVSCNH